MDKEKIKSNGGTKNFIIFFGPPGSGKGTQAAKLAAKINLPLVSTGDLLRQEISKQSELGKIARKYMDAGKLVPDELLEELVSRRLKKSDAAAGVIFDGYPRNGEQQEFLLGKLKVALRNGAAILGILIDVSDEQVIERIGGRRACLCGAVYHVTFNPPKAEGICDRDGKKLFIRDDDKPEVVRDRLKTYHKQSRGMFDYWEKGGKLLKIDGGQPIDKVWEEIEGKLSVRGFNV